MGGDGHTPIYFLCKVPPQREVDSKQDGQSRVQEISYGVSVCLNKQTVPQEQKYNQQWSVSDPSLTPALSVGALPPTAAASHTMGIAFPSHSVGISGLQSPERLADLFPTCLRLFLLHAADFKKMLVGFKNSFLWAFQRTGCLPAKNVWNGGFLSTMSLCYGVESAGPSS